MKSSISNFLTFGMVKKCYQCSVPNTNIIWEEFSACLFSDLFTQYSPAPIKSVILQSREIYRNSFWTDPQIQLRWSYFVGIYKNVIISELIPVELTDQSQGSILSELNFIIPLVSGIICLISLVVCAAILIQRRYFRHLFPFYFEIKTWLILLTNFTQQII